MPPRRMAGRNARASTGTTRNTTTAVTGRGRNAAGPSTRAPGRSSDTNNRAREAEADGDAPAPAVVTAVTADDLQQIIREELRKILQPQTEIPEPPRAAPSRGKRTARTTHISAPPEGANSPGRSRHSVFERLGALSARDRLGSRGVRLAREKREELERLRNLARAKKAGKETEAEQEGSSAENEEAEIMSGLKDKSQALAQKTDHLAKTTTTKKTPFGRDPNSPFSEDILDAPLPPNYKPPKISRYNGTTAPKVHISCFMTAMRFTGYDEAAYCQAFPMTLEGPAQTWFTGLKPGPLPHGTDWRKLSKPVSSPTRSSQKM
jgi:hypothetical protein